MKKLCDSSCETCYPSPAAPSKPMTPPPLTDADIELLRSFVDDLASLDCGSSACRFARTKTGMRNNGGCRCVEVRHPGGASRIVNLVRGLPAVFDALTASRAASKAAEERGRREATAQIVEALNVWADDSAQHFAERARGLDVDAMKVSTRRAAEGVVGTLRDAAKWIAAGKHIGAAKAGEGE